VAPFGDRFAPGAWARATSARKGDPLVPSARCCRPDALPAELSGHNRRITTYARADQGVCGKVGRGFPCTAGEV